MDKKKQIILVVLFILGISLCTWSIYKSALDNIPNTTTSENNSQTTKNQKTGNSTIINTSNAADSNNSQSATSNSANTQKSTDEKYVEYTVKSQDTLANICDGYSDNCPSQVLSKAILIANNLSSKTDIKTGMKLKIPEKYISAGFKYTVKTGDSLSTLAVKYLKDSKMKDAIKTILDDNFLSSENIQVGNILFIPSSNNTDETNSTSKNDTKSTDTSSSVNSKWSENLTSYTIKDGDTLDTLATKYEETCPKEVAKNIILKINNLSNDSDIKVGKTIKLPDKYLSSGEIYTVKTGDTLSSIASKYMTGVKASEAIKIISSDNSINNSNISVGKNIFIASID